MKNTSISSIDGLPSSEIAVRVLGPVRPKSDTTSGLTQEQGSFALAALIKGWSLSNGEIAKLVRVLYESVEGGKPDRFQKCINSTIRALRAQPFDLDFHCPHAAIHPRKVVHSTHVADLVSPSASEGVLIALADHVLRTDLRHHSAELDSLRLSFPDLHHDIIKGDVVKALVRVGEGGFPLLDHASFVFTAATHLKCLLVRTAHNRAAAVRDAHVDPYDCRFSGFDHFKTSGHVILSTLAAPAGAFIRFVAASREDSDEGAVDEVAIARVIKNRLLPHEDVADLADQARASIPRIRVRAGQGMDIRTWNLLAALEHRARPASKLNRGDMKDAGIDHQSFVEHLTGLTPAEAACYVAEELLNACDDVEPCIAAVLAGRGPPERQRGPCPEKRVGFVANILRAEAQCDARAPKLELSQLGFAKEFERSSNPGRPQVRSMRQKMGSDPCLAKEVRKRLSIDLRAWLAR